MNMRHYFFGYVGLLCCMLTQLGFAQHYTIKFASLAPEGSTWMNVLKEYDAAIRKESGGRLGFKIYPGGVQGEDRDVIRKMRLGQLHSAGLTGFGLGDIAPKVRILDSPFLFQSYDEVDHVYEVFNDEFEKAFRDNGYVLLGWAEVGWVYLLTNTPVRTLADMKGVKMWMWEGDKVAEATFKALGISPIPLSVIDVLTSLQTGLINGAYTSPLAALVLQWHTRVKYMMNLPLADASGAVVITKKKFDELPSDLQEILLRNGRKYMRELTVKSRKENADAITVMKKSGIQLIDIGSQQAIQDYIAAGKRARRSLVGVLYDQDFLDRVEKAVEQFRTARQPHTGEKTSGRK
ncbi:MAG TPA: TRAP transporter substrate-binding protein DctP [Bacteroidota bacterium]|nr:TRAP transporter substrate-binding protein DctP [Bacteroidota bacterium]